jgi:hypothetical protein
MSAYCTYEDVGVLLSLSFDSQSNPEVSKVSEIIEWISSEIDMSLNSIGITTVDSSSSLYKILKMRNAQGAAAIVGMSLYGNKGDIGSGQAAKYEEQYKKFLEDIDKRSAFYRGEASSSIVLSNQFTNSDMTDDDLDAIMLPDSFEA